MQREDADVRAEDFQTPRSSYQEVGVDLEETADGLLGLSSREKWVVTQMSMESLQLVGVEGGHLMDQAVVVVMAQAYFQTINPSDEMSKGGNHRRLCLHDLRQKGRGLKILLVADALSAGGEKEWLHPHPHPTRHEISSSCPESWQSGFL